MRIYLASRSPRRRKILRNLGIKFSILKPNLRESILVSNVSPEKYAQALAQMKVESVKHQVDKGIVIGMDTIVVFGKKILGKPKNRQEAQKMISLLSGQTHKVITGIYLERLPDKIAVKDFEVTKVKFRHLTDSEIARYIKTPEPYDKAGGYGIQGQAGLFVESIQGCYSNVIGLPVAKFLKLLKQLEKS
ncbi:MAG: Maf family protein [candidate division WOR-3 bacterium]